MVIRAGRVLLGRRSDSRAYYPGCWDLFGGHVEPDETPEVALARELSEELGIVPLDARAVMVATEPKPDVHGQGEFHVYVVTAWKGEPMLKNSEHDRLGWFTLAEAARLALADKAILAVLAQAPGMDGLYQPVLDPSG
jgi:8-oxo-dGTP diphosphatase